MHEIERQMKADKKQPEMQLPQCLVVHSSGHLREPVIKSAEQTEQDSTHDHVVKMRDNKIRVSELPIEWRCAQHDPGESGDQELK